MLTTDGARRDVSLRLTAALGGWPSCAALAAAFVLVSAAVSAQAPDLTKMDVVLRSVPDGPIARVNGVSITATVFIKLYSDRLAKIEKLTSGELSDGERVELALFCLYEVVEEELLFQEAHTRKIEVPSDAIKKEFDSHVKKSESTEAEVIKRLGFSSRDEVLRDFERIQLIKGVKEQIVEESGIEVTGDEIKKSYEQQKSQLSRTDVLSIRHMFFRAGGEDAQAADTSKTAAKKRADSAMALLRSGQRFEAVWESSSDLMNRTDEGVIRAPVSQLPQFLVDEAMKLEPGSTSGIIESENSYHIIQLVEFVPGKEPNFEKAEPLLRSMLYSEKVDDVIRDYVWELIDGLADVQRFLELESNVAFPEQAGN